MKPTSSRAYKSLGAVEPSTYASVAGEYYDERLHPTCADFRSAAAIYLAKLFRLDKPSGRIADVGCGRSLIANFCNQNLVLIDSSPEMLQQNPVGCEKRLIDVEKEAIGAAEFDWIFAVLGDPYNSQAAWNNIRRGLKLGGQCIFIVPSREWAQMFRKQVTEEKPDLARFVTSKEEVVFLRSLIFEPKDQVEMISNAGLSPTSTEHVIVGDLPLVRSPKVFEILSGDQHLLDIYRAKRLK